MKISMIVAIGKNNEIGHDNKMLWHIPEDFKSFKEITMGHHMVMGRKTFESIGKPLPGRTSMVLSKNKFTQENVEVYDDVDELIEAAKSKNLKELFIIGGGKIYDLFMPIADKLYVSHVDYEGKADAFFPKIEEELWKIKETKKYEKTAKTPAWELKVYETKMF